VHDVPRLANAGSHAPSVKTLSEDVRHLHLFATWLFARGTTSFAEVTTADLEDYLRHVSDKPAASTHWKRKTLLAVQRLHAYRDVLPDCCRLPAAPLWGAASAAELAEHPTATLGENRTPRIHPDVMHPLLSAALLVTSTIAADLLPTARRLIAMRHLAHQVAHPARREPLKGTARRNAIKHHLDRLLPALAEAGHALPGLRQAGQTVVDIDGLVIGGWLDRTYLTRWPALRDAVIACDLPIKVNLLRATRFRTVDGQPWRSRPITATELVDLLRHVITASFLVTAYLSGVRTGEALNLRRGCITRDNKLGLTFMSGQQMKARPPRQERSPRTTPWVVTEQVAHAVSVLEDLTTGDMLFPLGEVCSPQWIDPSIRSSRRSGAINDDITAFISWFNTDVSPIIGHPPIGDDPQGRITAPRLRRTLAWHIVRRPGGTVAGATQYGHLRTQITHGYANPRELHRAGEKTAGHQVAAVSELHSGPSDNSCLTRDDPDGVPSDA
jgi:integrase